MCVYGDRAYPLRAHLQAPFRAGARALTPAMELYNKNMSKVRTSVEWIYGHVTNSFKSLDYKNNLKIGLSTIGKMYVVCAIIRNALTCMYGNQTSAFFAVEPPSVQIIFLLARGIARQEVHKILFSCVALACLITFIQNEYFV